MKSTSQDGKRNILFQGTIGAIIRELIIKSKQTATTLKHFSPCSLFLLCFFSYSHTQATAVTQTENALIECRDAMDNYNYKRLLYFSEQLIEYTHHHRNKRVEAYAYFYKGVGCLFAGKSEQSIQLFSRSKDLAKEIQNDSIIALALSYTGVYEVSNHLNLYIGQHYFLESLQYAKRVNFDWLEGRIYANLTKLANIQRDPSGLKYAEDCYNFGLKHKNERLAYLGAYKMGEFLFMKKDSAQALEKLYIARHIQEKNKYGDFSSLFVYATILKHMKQYGKAEKVLSKLIKNTDSQNLITLPEAYFLYAMIYNEKHDFNQSIEMLNKALFYSRKYCNNSSFSEYYQLLSKNYEELGDKNQALRFLKEAHQESEKMNVNNIEHLKYERELKLKLIEQEHEAQMHRKKVMNQRKINLMLAISLGLLLIIMAILIKSQRTKNRLYRNIVKQNTEVLEREEVWKNQCPEEETDSPVKSEDEKKNALFTKLCLLMEKKHLYRNEKLQREQMANLLNTNHTYLTNIIAEKTGMNFPQFVNSYRIHEAVRILSDISKADYPLKQLCFDIGFSSLSTFYKAFQENVGMSPSTYRKSARSMDKTK